MAALPYTISNPAENNVALHLFRVDAAGREHKLALLRPGEQFRADQTNLRVRAVPLPARLYVTEEGAVRPDNRATPPRLRCAGRAVP